MTLPLYVFDEEAKLAREALRRERDFTAQPSNSPGWQPGIGESLPGQPGGPSWGTPGGYGAESSQEPFSWTRHAAMQNPGPRPPGSPEWTIPPAGQNREKLKTKCDRLREEGARSGYGPDWQRIWWEAGCNQYPPDSHEGIPIPHPAPGLDELEPEERPKWPGWPQFKWDTDCNELRKQYLGRARSEGFTPEPFEPWAKKNCPDY